MSPIRDVVNFRDLGGYEMTDGRFIKRGLFYRSGGLYLMNEEELAYARSLGIRFVLDLRTTSEVEVHPDPVIEGAIQDQQSGLESKGGKEIDFSPTGMSRIGEEGKDQFEKLKQYYQWMPFDNDAFHILFNQLEQHRVPIVFHCATGKDRTGVAAMLILLALGASEGTVLKDYMLSNVYRKEELLDALESKKELFEQNPEARILTIMKDGVSSQIGLAVLDSIKEKYGTYENYFLQEYGWDKTKLEAIRNEYLTDN